MYLKRTLETVAKSLSAQFPFIVVSGARQVEKPTTLQMIKDDDMKYVTLDDYDAKNLALSGAIFETCVVSEIIKNLTAHGVDPKGKLYYYRDKDRRKIDLIYVEADALYPIEIKKGVSPSSPDKNFKILNKLYRALKTRIVLCAAEKLTPINEKCWLYPIDYI